jgi:cell division septation protein DedD
MVLAFYLGLNSGQRLGFELAQERTATALPRLPVPGASPEGSVAQDDGAFDVYAKLNDTLPGAKGEVDPIKVEPVAGADSPLDHTALFPSDGGSGAKGNGMPELGSIKSVESAPLIAPEAEAALNARLEENAPPLEEPKLGDAVPAVAAVEQKATEAVKPIEREVKPQEPKPAAKAPSSDKSSSFLRKKIPGGWYAQVGAMPSLAEADRLAQKLKGSGFAVMIEAALVRGDNYFRILVGPERSKQQADLLLAQLRRERYIEGDPFLRVVK